MEEIVYHYHRDMAYQELLGMSFNKLTAQREQRQATLDRLGRQFFFQGQIDPQDPEAAALMQQAPDSWENILESYAHDKLSDWLRERVQPSLEQQALELFRPEERQQLELMRGLAQDAPKNPRIKAIYQRLAGENTELLRRYENAFSRVSRPLRAVETAITRQKTTLDPSAGRAERALGQQAEADYDTEGFGSDLAFADQRQLNPGHSEQETSNDYRLQPGGKAWKSLDASLRDRPDLPPALYQEGQQRRWERQVIEELPTEAQEAYKALYAPESAVDKKWRDATKAGELTPEQQAERKVEEAAADEQVQANLAAWREARDTERNPDDEWGQKLNNTDLRPVPLRRMVEEEYAPEDEQRLATIIQRDFLSREKPEVQARYADDPIAYAEDYEVLNKPKMPAVISGRDELTPTRRELVPELKPRERAAIAQKEAGLASLEEDYTWLDKKTAGFRPEQKSVIAEHRKLRNAAQESIATPEAKERQRAEAKAFYEQHKETLDASQRLEEARLDLDEASRELNENLKDLNRRANPVITDRPRTYELKGEDQSTGAKAQRAEFARKRIPIEQYNVQQKKWVKKAIDPMQLVIQEMSHKKNFSADPDKFVDEVAAALESGLAGILYNKSLGIRLDTEDGTKVRRPMRWQYQPGGAVLSTAETIDIDPETIIYTRKGGGLQLRWKDLNVKGSERMKRILSGLGQRYKQAPSDEAREAITATAESVKQDMRLTVDGAGQVAAREEQLARKRLANDPAALDTEIRRIEQQRKSDLRAIGAERGKERWLSEQDGSAVQEMGDGLETTAGEAQPLPQNQSNKWVDNMARDPGPYAPDKRGALSAQEPTRWAPKPLGVKKIEALTNAQGVQHPAREIPNGYEVSTKGDKRFSQFGARLKDGRNIDTAFKQAMPALRQEILQQATKAEAEDVARRREIARKKGQDPEAIQPREIVEREPTPKEVYPVYKALWEQWATENPDQVENLRKKAGGRPLTDQFMGKGAVSPARALAEILDESAPCGVNQSQYQVLPGQKARPNAPSGLTQSQLEAQCPAKGTIVARAAKAEAPQTQGQTPLKSPAGEFGVYGEGPGYVGPPAMPKPYAYLRPSAPPAGRLDSDWDLIPTAASTMTSGIARRSLAQTAKKIPTPVNPLPMTPQHQVTQARDRAAPVRIDPKRVTAERLDTPAAPQALGVQTQAPAYQPLLDDYRAALAGRDAARHEVLSALNRKPETQLASNTRLFQAEETVKTLRTLFIDQFGKDAEAATALHELENPPNAKVKPNTQVSPNFAAPRPNPRALPAQTRLSLKSQPAADPLQGQSYAVRNQLVIPGGKIPFTNYRHSVNRENINKNDFNGDENEFDIDGYDKNGFNSIGVNRKGYISPAKWHEIILTITHASPPSHENEWSAKESYNELNDQDLALAGEWASAEKKTTTHWPGCFQQGLPKRLLLNFINHSDMK